MKTAKAQPQPPTLALPSPGTIVDLRCDECSPGAVNRQYISAGKIKEYADSIRELGVMSPILVRPRPRYTLREPDLTCKEWVIVRPDGTEHSRETTRNLAEMVLNQLNEGPPHEIVFGECRWRACNLLKRATIPAMVRQLDDRQVYKMRLTENLKREDPNALDEAAQMKAALDSGLFGDKIALAKELGCQRSRVYARLRLLELPEAVKQAMLGGHISPSIGELLATIPEQEAQLEALKEVLTRGEWIDDPESDAGGRNAPMSFRKAKAYIGINCRCNLKQAPWPLDDEMFQAGSCKACPKRSGNLDPDSDSPNICTDPKCFDEKRHVFLAAETNKLAQAKGLKPVPAAEVENIFYPGGQLRHNSEYVPLDHEVPGDPKGRTFGDLLKKEKDIKPSLAIAPGGQAVELLPQAEAVNLMHKHGLATPEERREQSKEDITKQQAKQQAEAAEADAALTHAMGKLVARVEALKLSTKANSKFWQQLIQWYVEGQKRRP
jgi:ParB/RepB/Spo0J family partition protein